MSGKRRFPVRTWLGLGVVAMIAALLAVDVKAVSAQDAGDPHRLLRVEAVPLGALPPIALPMPASRNHNYWGVRVQAGHRRDRVGPDLLAVAGGVDLQWRGGSIFGITGGYQLRDCEAGTECDGHALFGARARFNVVTGGPTIANWFGDYSATSTLGAEIGFGYAPDATPDMDACVLDVGVPISVAMLQEVRVVAHVMPTIAWEIHCGDGPSTSDPDFVMNAGVGIQQLILDGLDVYLGFQKVSRGGTGYQFGLSVMYVHLP